MIEKVKMILTVALCIILPSATIYALTVDNQAPGNESDYTELELMALNFLKNCPTFSYDGVTESISILEKYTLESYPEQHIFIIAFNTTHAGWGNREGTFTAQVITPHVIKIKIVQNIVVEAIIDDVWDELLQEQIIPEELLLPEKARDIALRYILQEYSELSELTLPKNWLTQITTPARLLGSTSIRYMSEGWTVDVNYPIVQYPEFSLEVEYDGDISFSWKGIVHNDGEVSTSEFILE